MIRNSGHADLPLHTGTVPAWLSTRMSILGTSIVESIILNYGQDEVLRRLSDPLWFQSFGSVLGMDWHSSGITTSVMYALKRGINPKSRELGIFICGGRGKYSRQTPEELLSLSEQNSLDAEKLIRTSRLVAKIDNNAVQDGFQLYQHNFILSSTGTWAIVQQGMNVSQKKARRYHWCSQKIKSFTEEPHSGIVGENKGQILNLTDINARNTKKEILEIAKTDPQKILSEIKSIYTEPSQMILLSGGKSIEIKRNSKNTEPSLFPELEEPEKISVIHTKGRNLSLHAEHDVLKTDVDLKRLGGVLATSWENQPENFEELLLTKNLGPRTLQALTLVSEVIHGTPSRFSDPARFSFAHGGKDGKPFPVPLKIYDESIRILHNSIEKSKLNYNDKSDCIKRLHQTALSIEKNCSPEADFEKTIQHEKENSKLWGGKTVSIRN